jgi:hypothetical protein
MFGIIAITFTSEMVSAADKAAKKEESSWPSWSSLWPFGSSSNESKKPTKPATGTKKEKEEKDKTTSKPIEKPVETTKTTIIKKTPEEMEKLRLQRRLDACDKLKSIALEQNDAEMERQVQELENRVWAIYTQRTTSSTPSRSPENDAELRDLAKKMLNKPNESALERKLMEPSRTGERLEAERRPVRAVNSPTDGGER